MMILLRPAVAGLAMTAVFLIAVGAGCDASKMRVVSLAPSTTEILFALGLDDEIVGVSSFCDYPPQAQTKTKVGTFSQPNVEMILSLKPDIVFCTGLEQGPIITKLKQLGLNTCVSDPASLNELFESIRDIGRRVGRTKEAVELVTRMSSDIDRMRRETGKVPRDRRPKVFVEIWHSPLMTAGKKSFLDEIIEASGGINIAHATDRPYANYSQEAVIRGNPDVIILCYMGGPSDVSAVKRRTGWQDISAIKNNRVYNDIDPDIMLKPGPRLTEGMKELKKRFCP